MGQLQAEGFKPNFAYQIKLLGDRSDRWAFEAIGYQGRWLIDPDKHRRTNFKDQEYRKYRDNFDADVQSYIYFDYFVTDSDGKPVENCWVEVYSGMAPKLVQTDKKGAFSVEGLPEGAGDSW